MKTIKVNNYSALMKEVIKYKRLGYSVTYEVSGKQYVFRKGIRQIVQIVKES